MDLPNLKDNLEGVRMELYDSAFPLLKGVNISENISEAFKDIDVAIFIGAKPRGPGMERADLLKENGKIFIE